MEGRRIPLSKNKFELNLASREKLQIYVIPCFAEYVLYEHGDNEFPEGGFTKETKLI